MDEALVARDLRRVYGDTVALDGVSLTAARGEVLALVGPNGAGKTTLVRALTGTTDAEGTVALFGQSPRQVDRARIGLLPQDFTPAERLTARELVAHYAGLYDEPLDVDGTLADVGVADSAETAYENLSGGQRRRVCVATALINDPDLLVLDEPTTGIDPAGRRALWELLEGLAARGVTILVTTHYMEEAQRLADRVGLLADGQMVAIDAPETLVAEHGGDSRLRIEGPFTEDAPRDIDHPAAMTVRNGTLEVTGVRPESIGRFVSALDDVGLTYDSLTWSQPDLEDVYLELTGTAVTHSGDPAPNGATAGEAR